MVEMQEWRILVVEDEPDGQAVVSHLLNHFNIATVSAYTGEEAINSLESDDYTAAIIDLALPGIDGWGVLQSIRGNPRTAKLPCLAVTAFHTSQVRQQAIQAGFNAFFPKPLDDMTFVRELRNVIAKSSG
jgi:two-component system, cell cycle response regulator DivK